MPFAPDPEFAPAMAPFAEMLADAAPPPPGDVLTRRQAAEALFAGLNQMHRMPADVSTKDFSVTAGDSATLLLRWYTKENGAASAGPAVYYIHGGGMIFGSVALYDILIGEYVSRTGVPFIAVDYRLAPEHPHPTPVEDCYAGLAWFAQHAAEFGVDPARIAVMGDSAGGGLAAALALVARDRGGPVMAKQILIYPMLDDRSTTPDPLLAPFLLWTHDDNVTGWGALLGDAAGGDSVPYAAAPARAGDLSGLPPLYIEVGELDLFRDEDVEYARRASAAGVSAELHVHPGVPHAFEAFAPTIGVSVRALADRARAITSF